MFVRWIYKIWRAIWFTILGIVLIAVLASGITLISIQQRPVKAFIAKKLEKAFDSNYKGNIKIGKLEGYLPFDFELRDVSLFYPSKDSIKSSQPVFKCDTITFSINLWELLNRHIRVTSFNMKKPRIFFRSQGDSSYTLMEALKKTKPKNSNSSLLIQDLNIYAPIISIQDGTVSIDKFHQLPKNILLPQPLVLDSLNTRFFLELSNYQRFLDIDKFDAKIPNTIAGKISMAGQIFNDSHYLEFNQFNIRAGESHLNLNGEIQGVNLYGSNLPLQFHNARYKVRIDSTKINPSEFADIFPQLPLITVPVEMDFKAQGDVNDINIQSLLLNFDKSRLDLYGHLKNVTSKKHLSYDINIHKLHFNGQDLRILTHNKQIRSFRDWNKLFINGSVKGNLDSLTIASNLNLDKGKLQVDGSASLKKPYLYSAKIQTKNLDISQFATLGNLRGYLNMNAKLKGKGYQLNKTSSTLAVHIYDSQINNLTLSKMTVNAALKNGFLEPKFDLHSGSSQLTGNGWIDLIGSEPIFRFEGIGSAVNLSEFIPKTGISGTSLNFKYQLNVQGKSLNRMYGRASMDINRSIVGRDTLRPHQLYVDLNSPDNKQRELRFTSTFMDLIMKGHMKPADIYHMSQYWASYFEHHIHKEIEFQPVDTLSTKNGSGKFSTVSAPSDTMNVSINMHLKDLGLLHHYFKKLPLIKSPGHLEANVKADAQRLWVTGGWQDQRLDINDSLKVNNSKVMLTASFNHHQNFRQFANLDISASLDSLSLPKYSFGGINWEFSMRNDTVQNMTKIGRIGKNASLTMHLSTNLLDTALVMNIDNFNLGNKTYQWSNKGKPAVIFDNHDKLAFKNFEFVNGNQRINILGAFSSDKSDSVTYSLQNINLQRISDLINGRVNFEGTLNADFYTKSLAKVPRIQGNIYINRLALDKRPIGDFRFHSQYDPQEKRFNTNISVKADTSKYHNYYVKNDSIATNIQIKGYFLPPDLAAKADTSYDFHIDFKQIDMWVVNYIIPGIFSKLQGRANGTGYIAGNAKNYNFHAHFNLHNVHSVPVFLHSNFYLTGPINLDRYKGVTIDSVRIHDKQGGTGLLYGHVGLNNFKMKKKLDLTLVLNHLKFLNNQFGPDVPFYGGVVGSGTVRLTGSNLHPFLQTVTPLRTTSNSKLLIPLLDETTVQSRSKSIQFVKSFKVGSQKAKQSGKNAKGKEKSKKQEPVSPRNETFMELFQLDLQFVAPQNSTVEFIFDPVTGEELTARGGGNINITLQDQNLQMFGHFDITSGNYLFVGGGVFSRKFYLQNGGTITWEGDPKNPRINITSVYRAHPNIKPITNENRRIPINLILKLTGNIKSLQNQFYFQFPNTPDVSQSSSILSFLNSEDQKLLQATSLLLTGGFSTVNTQNGNENQGLGTNLQNKVTQVGLSQLLSNQINTLLNSSLSDLNIDLNMTGFEQADLGIALRLFNDRLVLRREGVIGLGGGGPQYDNIGDLGAEYQINNSLSVEVFHRQDPTLSSSYAVGTTSPLPSVNGVGLKYQVQFNTWKELPKKVAESIISIFRKKKKKEKKKKTSPADTTSVALKADKPKH